MNNKLGDIINKLRKEKGLTQKDLADELNISDKAVSRWETGNSFPDLDMIFRISKFFNVSFKDLLQARVVEDNTDDQLVKEIIDEFTEMSKKNSKRIKMILLITLGIILILTISIIFTSSYNRFKVYRVAVDSDDFVSNFGVYVETKIKDTLYLGNLKLKNIDVKETDIVSVEVYILDNNSEEIVFNSYRLNDIYFTNTQSYIEIEDLSEYFDKLYLRVTVIDDKNEAQIFDSKLNFEIDFTNNKIFYNDQFENILEIDRSLDFNEDKIVETLLENGFKKSVDNILFKRTKDYVINYNVNLHEFNYSYEKNKLNYRYIYYLKFDRLEVFVFDENNTEIEKYTYDVNNDKVIECVTGSCNNYKIAMKLLNENILNLLKD